MTKLSPVRARPFLSLYILPPCLMHPPRGVVGGGSSRVWNVSGEVVAERKSEKYSAYKQKRKRERERRWGSGARVEWPRGEFRGVGWVFSYIYRHSSLYKTTRPTTHRDVSATKIVDRRASTGGLFSGWGKKMKKKSSFQIFWNNKKKASPVLGRVAIPMIRVCSNSRVYICISSPRIQPLYFTSGLRYGPTRANQKLFIGYSVRIKTFLGLFQLEVAEGTCRQTVLTGTAKKKVVYWLFYLRIS